MSRRRRSRLQRLKHSFVVTVSAAAAAGSAGCDAFGDPGSGSDPRHGGPGFGPAIGIAGTGPVVPQTMNPPFVNPVMDAAVPMTCPSVLPVAGAPCHPTTPEVCTFPAFGDPCLLQPKASCISNLWSVATVPAATCNPPEVGPEVDVDAGLEDDAGLDGEG